MSEGLNVDQHAFPGQQPGLPANNAHIDKPDVLADYCHRFHVKTLVETGLYQGHGSGESFQGTYVAIDWQEDNIDAMLSRRRDTIALHGDSSTWIPKLLGSWSMDPDLQLPVLFWLDAHALDEDEGTPTVCPLIGELEAIVAWEHADTSVVLVDDLAFMGVLRGWPTLDELRALADRGPWQRSEQDGIMRLTPA